MTEAITIQWASTAPILVEPARGIPVTVTLVSTEPVEVVGVLGIPGPKGNDGDSLDPDFIIDGGNF